MREKYLLFFLGLLIAVVTPSSGFAISAQDIGKTRYISDFLLINLRDRLAQPSVIVGVVKSGETVTILEINKGYYKVETEKGKQGWISKQYIKSELPKPMVIEQLKKTISYLEDQIKDYEAKNSPAQSASFNKTSEEWHQLEIELKSAQARAARLLERQKNSQLDISSQASQQIAKLKDEKQYAIDQLQNLTSSYNDLLAKTEVYEKQGADLQRPKITLADRKNYYWFATGAMVFLVGLLFGKIGGRKKSKYSY